MHQVPWAPPPWYGPHFQDAPLPPVPLWGWALGGDGLHAGICIHLHTYAYICIHINIRRPLQSVERVRVQPTINLLSMYLYVYTYLYM